LSEQDEHNVDEGFVPENLLQHKIHKTNWRGELNILSKIVSNYKCTCSQDSTTQYIKQIMRLMKTKNTKWNHNDMIGKYKVT